MTSTRGREPQLTRRARWEQRRHCDERLLRFASPLGDALADRVMPLAHELYDSCRYAAREEA